MALIAQTEEQAPEGVKGTYQFFIKASGMRRGDVFLNTENDYRDRRNITLVLPKKLNSAFIKKYGSAPNRYFINKTVEVTGEVNRVIIDFISNGKPSGAYYFQTQLNIASLQQIKVVN
jgi:hypothetical protein